MHLMIASLFLSDNIDITAGIRRLCAPVNYQQNMMSDFANAKHNMIEQQIRPWEVIDPQVLSVFDELNRDQFVPEALKGLAYADCHLPVVGKHCMLPPIVEGRMLQALNIKPSDCVLEIGTRSGYITACLAHLATHVDSVDILAESKQIAQQNLQQLDISNVALDTINSLQDIKHSERYDAIAVCAGSVEELPENLKQALVIGGRLFVVTGQSPAKHAQLITRIGQTEWQTNSLFETDIPAI
jgi:protein-L-isoaspartate(D-aspartate) O-methyltransferase